MKYYFIWKNTPRLEAILLVKREGIYHLPKSIDSFKENLHIIASDYSNGSMNCDILREHKTISLPVKYEWVEIEKITELAPGHGALLCFVLSLFWPGMTNSPLGQNIPSSFIYKINPKEEVTFYGGSFNPWHDGHRICLDLCPNKNIIVVPDNNPWKEESATSSQHFCMWKKFREIAIKLKDTPYSVYPGFWSNSRPNPTVQWLPASSYSKKSLLIGDDSFFTFLQWKSVKDLITHLTKIYVVPRNYSNEDIQKKRFEVLTSFEGLEIIILDEHMFQDISSTKIRNSTKN